MTVYLITNRENGKYYVGQTVMSPRKRLLSHFVDAKRCSHRFANALKKYGREAFVIEVLAEARTKEQLNELEKLWTIALNATHRDIGYNTKVGGLPPVLKGPFTKEHSQKISASLKAFWADPVNHERQSKANIGKKCPRDAGHRAWLGQKHTEETKRKMSLAAKKRYSTNG